MPHKETPLHDSIIHCNGDNMSQETIKMINVMAEKAFNMKETKTPTLFGVTPDKEIFEKLKSEITKNGRSIDYLDIPYLCEAYRIERNKQEAPDEKEIETLVEQFKCHNTWDSELLEAYEMGIIQGINHFSNLNK